MIPRLLVDENISWRIKRSLASWDIMPVNEIDPSRRRTDKEIWIYAKQHNYTILTFDEDLVELQNIYDFPPKIIWLRTGNVSTVTIADHLLVLENKLIDFINNEEAGVFEVYL